MNLMSLDTIEKSEIFDNLDENTKNTKVEGSLKIVVNMILDALTPELSRSFILICLDSLQELVKKTDNKVDDVIIGVLANKARAMLSAKEETSTVASAVSNFIEEKTDEYLKEIDFGTTDVMKALSSGVSSQFKNISFNPFEKK